MSADRIFGCLKLMDDQLFRDPFVDPFLYEDAIALDLAGLDGNVFVSIWVTIYQSPDECGGIGNLIFFQVEEGLLESGFFTADLQNDSVGIG